MRHLRVLPALSAALLLLGACAGAQQPAVAPKPADTEAWTPVPPVVTAGASDRDAPSDAIRLFDGRNLDEWVNTRGKTPAGWTVSDGMFTVNKPVGNIETKRSFRNYQLHIEWRIPANITGTDQGRGNSGLFLASTGDGDGGYELQILDSYVNKTYVNGQAASIYKQSMPLVNSSRKPGEWQTYDIVFHPPKPEADGKVTPGSFTILHNGVLTQDHVPVKGDATTSAKFSGATPTGPLMLQNHGNPVRYRNIWIRELKD